MAGHDAERPSADEAFLAEHLALCADCSALRAEIDHSTGHLAQVRPLDPPDRLLARLLRIPADSFPCHRFPAAAAEAMEGRDDGGSPVPSPELAAHLETCLDCRTAWRILSLAGTLPVLGPRRDLFRTLTEIPRKVGSTESDRQIAPPAGWWPTIANRLTTDIRVTVAAAWILATGAVLVTGNPAALARRGEDRVSFAEAVVERGESLVAVDRTSARIETARWLARGRALPTALGKAYLIALRDRLFTDREPTAPPSSSPTPGKPGPPRPAGSRDSASTTDRHAG